MQIPRLLTASILDKLRISPKGIVLYGARQVGKTTLVNEVIRELGLKTLIINGDQSTYIDRLTSRNLPTLKNLLYGYDIVFIDEAQRIAEIGLILKIMLDSFPSIKIIATGSSSLDLASKISEPLTGRVWTYRLYPISLQELAAVQMRATVDAQLEERLIYGSYPEIFSYPGSDQKREYLQNLSDAYLYKDLIELGGLRNSAKIRNLLKLIAFQIGSQVSLSELGNQLDMSKDTVARYIDFLEKSYVIFRLSGLSRNLRKEVSKMDKIYFYDMGVRNILIDNLKPFADRTDVGNLWENFVLVERMKYRAYNNQPAAAYFWRTHTGAELDYVEEADGQLHGYEFKLSNRPVKAPTGWVTAYPHASFTVVNRDTYWSFVTGE